MGKQIMVVDDAAFMRKMIISILTNNGYEVLCEAVDGQDAMEKYKANKPDLIIMDITMPNVDGIEACKQLKSLYSDVKIVICSAMGQEKMVIEAIKSGALDFIVKPFQADKLIQTVKRIIG